jgi:hypothetical protein
LSRSAQGWSERAAEGLVEQGLLELVEGDKFALIELVYPRHLCTHFIQGPDDLRLGLEIRERKPLVLEGSQVDVSCALPLPLAFRAALKVPSMYSMYLLLVCPSSTTTPIKLSGKQASNPSTPVSAMFAAMVMQSVPFGHNLLWANPASL